MAGGGCKTVWTSPWKFTSPADLLACAGKWRVGGGGGRRRVARIIIKPFNRISRIL